MLRGALNRFVPRTLSLPFAPPLRAHSHPQKVHFRSVFNVADVYRELGLKCNDPTFFLINKLAHEPARLQELTSTLPTHSLSQRDHEIWIHVASALNFDIACKRLVEAGVPLSSKANGDGLGRGKSHSYPQPPTWLVLHLLRNKVTNSRHIQQALTLVAYHLPVAPSQTRPCLLVLVAYLLSRFNVAAPLRSVVRAFIESPSPPPTFLFNLMIRALSHAPKLKETSILAVALLHIMRKRRHEVSQEAFNDLLGRDFVTSYVAHAVENQMKRQGIPPTPDQLKALLRFAAHRGHRMRAGKYFTALRVHEYANRDSPISLGVNPRNHWLARVQRTEFDLIYMTSFRDLAKLSNHLGRIATVKRRPARWQIRRIRNAEERHRLRKGFSPSAELTELPSSPSKLKKKVNAPSATPGTLATVETSIMRQPPSTMEDEDVSTETQGSIAEDEDNAQLSPSISSGPLGVQEWTTALYVASRDKDISADNLYSLYERVLDSRKKLPMVTFTVVVKGLLRKWDIRRAVEVWNTMQARMLPLNEVSLGVGVAALTLNNEPYEAFRLLERVISEHHERDSGKVQPRKRHIRATKINTQAINQFSISLQRIGRPDVVFELWENMEMLYMISPDVYTLNILLKTARFAKKFSSNSFRGTLVELGLGRFLRGDSSVPGQYDPVPWLERRKNSLLRMEALLNPQDGRKPNVNGLWDGQHAPQVALQIVRNMFLNNWPELRTIRAPVRPLRQNSASPAVSPVRDLIHSVMGYPRGHEGQVSASVQLKARSSTPRHRYARIMPTDLTFRLYIDLLGTEYQSMDIPRALAWMRHLNIRPSKSTLATALVYWAEVSMDAPLIAALKGRSKMDPYSRLTGWLMHWVGERGMPSNEQIGEQMRRINYYRNSDYEGIIEQRLKNTESDTE